MGLALPPYYIIEPTNICNFRCPICPNSISYPPKVQGMMPMSLLDRILFQISDSAQVIQLYWMGEPLLNPHIFDMIKACKERTNAKIIMSTNGSLLSNNASQKLSESGLDEIIVSVDACDSQDIYGRIRVGGDVKTLNNNIHALIRNKGNMSIVLQFIDMFINRTEKDAFLEKWKNYDCKLEVSCLFTWSNQIPSLSLASDNLSPVLRKERVPCADLWNKMAIHWDGEVSACCFDYSNTLSFGNCAINSLIDIWNSKAAHSLRRQHIRGDYSISICKNCDAWAEPDEYIEMFHL